MSKPEDKGKGPARRMGLLIAFLIVGAVVLVFLWMRESPPGVKPSTGEALHEFQLALPTWREGSASSGAAWACFAIDA